MGGEAGPQVGVRWSATKMTAMLRKATMVAIVMAAAIGVSGCSYNRFVGQEEAVKTQWAEVENQLQRRNDLIPNLVETVKGYAQQERDVFGQIAEARSKLSGAQSAAPGVPTEQKIQAANEQSAALNRLLVIVENYPQLRSNESFNRLMDELSGTENRIAVARMRYNERVQEYNTARRSFPANVTASVFGFKEYPLFNAPPEAERAPRVDFGRNPS
jgi:LemA protein